ncbi:hypothetical protein LCGC14_2124090, partial [marine sediment metagenome]
VLVVARAVALLVFLILLMVGLLLMEVVQSGIEQGRRSKH